MTTLDRLAGSVNVTSLNERQRAILDLLDRADDGLSLREIHAQLPPGTTLRQVRRALAGLRDRSQALPSGEGPASRWKRRQD